jgi:hypothetical protein
MSGQSNGDWGDLAEHNPDLAEAWDRCRPLPEPGVNDALDAFVESKGLDIPSLVRVGARLTDDPTVLTYVYAGGLKYRSLETGQKWSYTGSEFRALKIVRSASGARAETALVVESETDAAKATILFPLLDVAVLPAGARHWTAAYTEQLVGYDLVLVGLDNDEAGEAGSEKILAVLPQAERFAPPDGFKDWCEVADAPPLPEPSESDAIGGIVFTDLVELLDAGVPEPEVLVDDVLYTEGVHLVSGHPGCGKTTLVAHWAWSVLADRLRHVVWFDYESGTRQTVRRLVAMGFPRDLVERFHYSGWPTDAEKHLGEVASRWPGALVVIDSMSKALSQAGIDENDNSQVTSWTTQIVQACKDNALPVVVIDHIAKAGGSSDYSRGAGAKLADVDVHWRIVKDKEFNRTTVGVVVARQKKDREGYFPLENWYSVGDGEGNLVIDPTEPDEVDTVAQIRDKILEFLKQSPEDSFTQGQVVSAARCHADDGRKVLDELADHPGESVVRVKGRRKTAPRFTYDTDKDESS